MSTTLTAARAGLPEDIDHDPCYRRQRELARYIIGTALNALLGRTIFDDTMEPVEVGRQLKKLAIEQGLVMFDDLHHAPSCPANHWHHQRLPTGGCTCGATRGAGRAALQDAEAGDGE